MKPKIVLINPNTNWQEKDWGVEIPYGICMLKAALNEKYDATVLDLCHNDISVESFIETLRKMQPDAVGISCMAAEFHGVFAQTAAAARQILPSAPIIVGGVYPTLLPEPLLSLPEIDYVVQGEGEERIVKLLDYLFKQKGSLPELDGVCYKKDGEITLQPVSSYIPSLDSLSFPDYSDLDYADYANRGTKYVYYNFPRRYPYARTVTSRGCPFKCIFCSAALVSGKQIRYRSPENVVKEIDWLEEKFGIKEILFYDDNVSLNRDRFKKLLQALIDRKSDLIWKTNNIAVYTLDDEILELARRSGLYQLNMALESGTMEVLKHMKKPTKRLQQVRDVVKKARTLDYEVTAMWVFGMPAETWEQIRETFRFAESLDLDYNSFNIASPLPKTELLEIAKKEGLLKANFDFDDKHFFGYGKANITTKEFMPEELQILRAFEWDRINFKTDEKCQRVAAMNGISLDELAEWRVSTRRKVLHV